MTETGTAYLPPLGLSSSCNLLHQRTVAVADKCGLENIDECANPAIASRCVANSECCNLPAHFLCKCKPGFHGDGEVECKGAGGNLLSPSSARPGPSFKDQGPPDVLALRVIVMTIFPRSPVALSSHPEDSSLIFFRLTDLLPHFSVSFMTGSDSLVVAPLTAWANTLEFYIDECQLPNACGINTVCINLPGNYTCDCQHGYHGNPYNGVSRGGGGGAVSPLKKSRGPVPPPPGAPLIILAGNIEAPFDR
ncbi:unnamed protein product [Bemisia tabaci]|uniref:EGF-like domain-containing protein n=1 Tax=Bemisia tabaci TaxID=7038 RepID=A0A9P0F3Q7_BEMTA|nr:unnamed protein product [Bemisia tabaci]